jgi:hypothetical protein
MTTMRDGVDELDQLRVSVLERAKPSGGEERSLKNRIARSKSTASPSRSRIIVFALSHSHWRGSPPSVGTLRCTSIAAPFELHLEVSSRNGARNAAHGDDLYCSAGEACHAPAAYAEEMRMFAEPAVRSSSHFETPNVIANVAASHEIGLDEIDQIAIDGRPVKSEDGHLLRDLAMRHRSWRML